jgi:hypothetical protein
MIRARIRDMMITIYHYILLVTIYRGLHYYMWKFLNKIETLKLEAP